MQKKKKIKVYLTSETTSGFVSPNRSCGVMLRLREKRVGDGDAATHPPSSWPILQGLAGWLGDPSPFFLPQFLSHPLPTHSWRLQWFFSPVLGGFGVPPPAQRPWWDSLGRGPKARAGHLLWDPPHGGPIPLPGEAVPDPAATQIPARPRGRALPAAGTSRGAVSSARQQQVPSATGPSLPAEGPPPPFSSGRGAGHPAPALSPAPSFGEAGNRGESGPAQRGHERDPPPRAPTPPPAPQHQLEVRPGGSVALGTQGHGARWL